VVAMGPVTSSEGKAVAPIGSGAGTQRGKKGPSGRTRGRPR